MGTQCLRRSKVLVWEGRNLLENCQEGPGWRGSGPKVTTFTQSPEPHQPLSPNCLSKRLEWGAEPPPLADPKQDPWISRLRKMFLIMRTLFSSLVIILQ